MRRSIVLACLLVVICIAMRAESDKAFTPENLYNLIRQISMLGVYSIGVGIVIITSGIDLSVGSIIGLIGLLLAIALSEAHWSVPAAVAAVLLLALVLGLIQGLLVAYLRLQPFIVTLCGLLIYRGIGRFITEDNTKGFGIGFEKLKFFATGHLMSVPLPGGNSLPIPVPFWILVAVSLVAILFLHMSVYGRHLFALGRNEDAARYSGVKIERMTLLAYVISAGLAGLAGILYALYVNAVQPANHGNMYELYAIAACVLGGCSLRGGEGTVIGIVLGAAVIPILRNYVSMAGLKDLLEYALIGFVILVTVAADEIFKGQGARKLLGGVLKRFRSS